MAFGDDPVLRQLGPGYGDGVGRQKDGLQKSKLAHGMTSGQVGQTGGVGSHAAPLASHARQAVDGPAGFLAFDAF